MGDQRIAIYPGTFDPLTNGHLSIIRRGLDIFDRIVVAVARDTQKKTLFNLDERLAMANQVFEKEPRVSAEAYEGLTVEFARQCGARVILRGLRAVSDFEFEFQLALMNRRLDREIRTVFMMTDYKWLYVSSTIIKEAVSLGGNIAGLVPDTVLEKLREKYDT